MKFLINIKTCVFTPDYLRQPSSSASCSLLRKCMDHAVRCWSNPACTSFTIVCVGLIVTTLTVLLVCCYECHRANQAHLQNSQGLDLLKSNGARGKDPRKN